MLTAIAKIGGLFALLKFSVLLQLWHHSLFVKQMNKNTSLTTKSSTKPLLSLNNESVLENRDSLVYEKETTDFREMFSYENLRKEISMIRDMRETIEGQREVIEE